MLYNSLDRQKYQIHFTGSNPKDKGTDSPNHSSGSRKEAERDPLDRGKIKTETAKAGI